MATTSTRKTAGGGPKPKDPQLPPPAAVAAGPGPGPTNNSMIPPCTLRRDEIACLKTALAVIVTKRRLQLASSQHHPQQTKKVKPSNASTALASLMGRRVSLTQNSSSSSRSSNHSVAGSSARSGSVVRFSDQLLTQRSQDEASTSTLSQQQQLPLQSASNWASHLQHILQMTLQGVQQNNARWQGLCVHVACQLEQVMMAQKQQENAGDTQAEAPMTLSAWVRTQLVAFVVPTKDNVNASNMLQSWFTIWKSVIQAKPATVAELLVPILLELLLLQHPKPKSPEDSATTTLRLEPPQLLLLLETALAPAPTHVLQATLDALSPDANNINNVNKLLLPSTNTSWYLTQDLACDYYYYCSSSSNNNSNTGQVFLLGHGLAALSEALTLAVANSSSSSG